MNQGLIPGRYAKALYEFACESDSDKRIFGLMHRLDVAFASEPQLAKVMANPFVPDADKVRLLCTAADVKPGADAVFERFMQLLVDNNRLSCVRDIALAYMKVYRSAHGIRRVSVVSAAPLAPADEDRLKKLISTHLGGGEMEYTHSVNPDLIGGFTVSIDNEKLDASVANELKQLRLKLLS